MTVTDQHPLELDAFQLQGAAFDRVHRPFVEQPFKLTDPLLDRQRWRETADWLANELSATKGIRRMFATGGDLQVAIRRSREPA